MGRIQKWWMQIFWKNKIVLGWLLAKWQHLVDWPEIVYNTSCRHVSGSNRPPGDWQDVVQWGKGNGEITWAARHTAASNHFGPLSGWEYRGVRSSCFWSWIHHVESDAISCAQEVPQDFSWLVRNFCYFMKRASGTSSRAHIPLDFVDVFSWRVKSYFSSSVLWTSRDFFAFAFFTFRHCAKTPPS